MVSTDFTKAGTLQQNRAFPGWRSEAIHEAMNESKPSVRTKEILDAWAGCWGHGRRRGRTTTR